MLGAMPLCTYGEFIPVRLDHQEEIMRFKKGLALAAASAMALTAVTGCSGANKVSLKNFSTTSAATYGNEPIYLDELLFYARMEQASMEYVYSLYSSWGFISDPLDKYYDSIYDEEHNLTAWQAVKQGTVREVYQTRVLSDYAKEHDITLSESDLKKVEEEVSHYMTGDEAYLLDGLDLSEELIKRIFTDNALANRAHEKLSEGYDETINREDFRVARAYYFTIPKDEYEDTDEEQRAKDVLAAFQDAYEKADKKIAEVKMSTIADEYSDKDETETTTAAAGEVITASTEAAAESTAAAETKHKVTVTTHTNQTISIGGSEAKLAKGIADLTNDSFVFLSDETYYYALFLSERDDDESTQSRIDSELETRKTEKFNENYAELLKSAPEIKVNKKIFDANIVYRKINYPEATTEEPTEEVTTAETTTAETTTDEATTAEVTTAEATTAEETTEEVTTEEAATEDTTAEADSESALTEEAPTEEGATEEAPTGEAVTEEAPSAEEETVEATTATAE